jgi:hypothetical protein
MMTNVLFIMAMSKDQLLIMLLQLKFNKILALSKAALVHLRISIFSNNGHLGWHLDLPGILLSLVQSG